MPQEARTPADLVATRGTEEGKRSGPRALFLLLQVAGKHATLEEVAAEIPPAEPAASLEPLQRAATKFGIQTVVRAGVSPEGLKHAPLPAIVHCNAAIDSSRPDHFVLVSRYDEPGRQFVGIDATSLSPTSYSVEAMGRNMSGNCLLLEEPLASARELIPWDALNILLWVVFGALVVANLWYAIRLLKARRAARSLQGRG